ncbi:hypothetical protein IGI37_000220 [Enterococcus sp. AZ194]|uniref:oligosaccharide flippase family protein n=1 Tax=Enterococcus sp. AZ194 TaxID=2774629 RepID=UPI003F20A412
MSKEPLLKKNILFNVLRSSLSIIFPLLTFPYISRVLNAEGLGKYEFSRTFVNYFLAVISIGVGQYAIREGSIYKKQPKELQRFSNQLFSIFFLVTLSAYLLLTGLVAFLPVFRPYRLLIMILSIQILTTTLSIEWIYTIFEDFAYIAIRSLIVQLASIVCMFLLVKSADDYVVYAWITTLSISVAHIFNFIHGKKFIRLKLTKEILFKKHYQPILILMTSGLASTIYLSVDVLLLGILTNDYTVGIYSVAVKVYTIIKSMASGIIYAVNPRLTFYKNNEKQESYEETLRNLFWLLVTFLLPTVVGTVLLRKEIVDVIAGNGFIESSQPLLFLALALFPSILFDFLIFTVLLVNRKENLLLRATLLTAVFAIVGNFLLDPILKATGAATVTLLSELLVAGIAVYYSKNELTLKVNLKKMGTIALGCLGIVVICLMIQQQSESSTQTLLLAIPLSVLLYFLVLKGSKELPKI